LSIPHILPCAQHEVELVPQDGRIHPWSFNESAGGKSGEGIPQKLYRETESVYFAFMKSVKELSLSCTSSSRDRAVSYLEHPVWK